MPRNFETKAKSSLRFRLKTSPAQEQDIFLSGNFNHWLPDLPGYKMEPKGNGIYEFNLQEVDTTFFPIQYKYTLGQWERSETDKSGNNTPNRQILSPVSTIVRDEVKYWKSPDINYLRSFLPKVHVLGQHFPVPELQTTRRVSVLVPYNYDENPEKKYKVLYLQDAQNLFEGGSSYGNWAIDYQLGVLASQGFDDVIVVAIDHGNSMRIREFSPYTIRREGTGLGKKYLHFVAKTLKPIVDTNYRTDPNSTATGIGGSSMGGLISLYAAIQFPKTFGRFMIFSPSLWVSSRLFEEIAVHKLLPSARVFLYGGGKESGSMVPGLQRVNQLLNNGSVSIKTKVSIDPKGKHQEARWGTEFPIALRWLFESDQRIY